MSSLFNEHGLEEYTEFDEQASTKERGLANVEDKAREYKLGLESYGVLNAYELAAVRAGATWAEVESALHLGYAQAEEYLYRQGAKRPFKLT